MKSIIGTCCRSAVLVLLTIAIPASAHYWPELRLPIVIWLLAVALLWRSSPERDA